MKMRSRLLLSALVSSLLAACSQEEAANEADANIIAQVGEETLTIDEFQSAMERRSVPDTEEGKQALLEEMIDQLKLVHLAREQGLDRDPEFIREVEGLLAARVRASITTTVTPVSEDELQVYFNAHPNEFQIPARARLAMIFVKADESLSEIARAKKRARIEEALTQAETGVEFSQVAINYSEDQATRYRSGDLGYLLPHLIDPRWGSEAKDAIAELQMEGYFSRIVEGGDGYRFFKLLEKSPGSLRPFASVRGEILSKLQKQRSRHSSSTALDQATSAITISVDRSGLSQIKGRPPRPGDDQRPGSPIAISE